MDDQEFNLKYCLYYGMGFIKSREEPTKMRFKERMFKLLGCILLLVLINASAAMIMAENNLLDQLKNLQNNSQNNPTKDPQTVASGLKEALEVSTKNAVNLTGRVDGYFKNEAIKILMPPKLQKAEKVMRDLGQGAKVDEFILTMNRAAERAAPAAKKIFLDAIKQMSFQDAMKILNGNDTAATDYFRDKTYLQLEEAFKPPVTKAINDVGVTRSYKTLTAKMKTIPLINKVETVDIDKYVVTKALDGLFAMLRQEEKKIRKDPAARVTELLREVFGGK